MPCLEVVWRVRTTSAQQQQLDSAHTHARARNTTPTPSTPLTSVLARMPLSNANARMIVFFYRATDQFVLLVTFFDLKFLRRVWVVDVLLI
jgi:hypothetical protein